MRRSAVLLAAALLLFACSSTTPAEEPEGGELAGGGAAGEASGAGLPDPEVEVEVFPSRPDLAAVLDRAQEAPLVYAAREQVLTELGLREQAGKIPNPVLRLAAERFDTGDLGGGVKRYTIRASERIETAGKRGARVEVAGKRAAEAEADVRVVRLAVGRAAAGAHQRALAAEESVRLRREALAAVRDLLELTERRVAEGRGAPADLPPLRSRAGLLRAGVAEEEARLGSALRSLEGILTLAPGSIAGATGSLLNTRNVPFGGRNEDHPEVQVRAAAEETRRARSKEAEAGAWPDFVLGLGYEDFAGESGGRIRSVGVLFEMPLPLFDRNQGNIRASRSDLRRAEALTRDVRMKIATAHAEAVETARALETSREARRNEVIPALAEDLELARAAYRSGRTDLEPVLRARLTLAQEELAVVAIEERLAEKVLDALALSGLVPVTWTAAGGEMHDGPHD